MKKVLRYILKQKNGVHLLIALKAIQYNEKHKSGRHYFSLYDSIKMSLYYKHSPEEIYQGLRWLLNGWKEHYQYK